MIDYVSKCVDKYSVILVVTIILVYISSLRKTILTDFYLNYPFDSKSSL